MFLYEDNNFNEIIKKKKKEWEEKRNSNSPYEQRYVPGALMGESILFSETSGFKIEKSYKHGRGTFATKDLNKGFNLGKAFIKISNKGKPDNDYKRTILGIYTNHDNNPNLDIKKEDNTYYFIANRFIKKDEELTVNYKKFDFEGERDFIKN
jgi:hypothetical protein